MHPKGANKNIVDQAIFSNEGPNLSRPEETNIPNVIPKMYRLKNKKNKLKPKSNKEIPNRGEVKSIAGIKPIKALTKAVNISEIKISLFFIGETNKFVKFLLQISSKKSILKLMLDLKRIS